jgi:hypothetical protein
MAHAELIARSAARDAAVIRERVMHELLALRLLLDHLMRRASPGQRAIVRVGGDGYY